MAAIVGALRAVLSLESAAFQKGLSQSQKALQNFDKRMKAIGGKMQIAGAAISVAGAGIAAALRSQINAADDMSKAASKFGVPIEQLSRLKYAADLSDVSFETLGASIGRLSKAMVATPQKFTELGVAVLDADGKMRGADMVLADLADTFAGMPDGAEKTALAIKLFGKSGAEMIPLLNGGSSALRELSAESDAFGLTLNGETGAAAEKFNDDLTRLSKGAQGLAMQVASAMLPALQKMVDKLRAAATWFSGLSEPMKEFLGQVAMITIAAGPALIALGAVVSSLGAVATALKALTLLAVSNPIGAAITVIAVGAALIITNWEPIKQFFIDLWAAVSQAATDAWAATQQAWANTKAYFEGKLLEIRDAFVAGWELVKATTAQWVDDFLQIGRDIIDGLQRGIQEKWDAMIAWFQAKVDGMTGAMKSLLGIQSPSRVYKEIGGYITEGLAVGIEGNLPMVDTAMGGLAEAVDGNGLAGVADDAKESFKGLFSSILSGSQSAGEALSDMLSGFADKLLSSGLDMLWGAIFPNANGNAFSNGRVTAFANGGVVTGPTTFGMKGGTGLMGEAGPEAIMPLTRVGGKLGVMAAGGKTAPQVHYNIDARGASKGVDQLIAEALDQRTPSIVKQSVAATANARQRGYGV